MHTLSELSEMYVLSDKLQLLAGSMGLLCMDCGPTWTTTARTTFQKSVPTPNMTRARSLMMFWMKWRSCGQATSLVRPASPMCDCIPSVFRKLYFESHAVPHTSLKPCRQRVLEGLLKHYRMKL